MSKKKHKNCLNNTTIANIIEISLFCPTYNSYNE